MASDHRTAPRTVLDRRRRRPGLPARDNRRGRCGAATAGAVRSGGLPRRDGRRPGRPLRRRSSEPAHSPAARARWTRRGIGGPGMFDPDQFHDPEFRSLVRATRAVIAERVHRGVASPPERLAVAALDEMPDEDAASSARAASSRRGLGQPEHPPGVLRSAPPPRRVARRPGARGRDPGWLPRRAPRAGESPLERVDGRLDAVIARLLFMAGMRRSEVSALRWACARASGRGPASQRTLGEPPAA